MGTRDLRVKSDEDMYEFIKVNESPERYAAMRQMFSDDKTEAAAGQHRVTALSFGKCWARGKPPKDRPGMVAVLHPCLDPNEDLIHRLSMASGKKCWIAQTAGGWVMWGFMVDDEGPFEPTDQYMAVYDADGTYHLVGCS